jgi:myo-inositol-1(or 4)-monophosphatase
MIIDLETPVGKALARDIALAAAREAGKKVLAGWRAKPTVMHKSAIDLVTNYDFESERYLRETLSAQTPFAFVGEEEGGQRPTDASSPTWYVDPLDGTTNFAHGHPFFSVSVGLVVGTRPVVGVVVAPAIGIEWAGAEGIGATRNGVACAVSTVSDLDSSYLATGFPYDKRTSAEDNLDAFAMFEKRVLGIRRCGSAAMDLCMVGDGTYDGYWERKLKVWDLAAGAAIVRASGGKLTNYLGGEDDVTSGQLIATNGRIHEALVAALGELPSTHRG